MSSTDDLIYSPITPEPQAEELPAWCQCGRLLCSSSMAQAYSDTLCPACGCTSVLPGYFI